MDYVNDIEEYQNVLQKIDMTESSLPTWNGRLVENVDCYNKVRTLLDIPQFEKAHKMLYRINFDELTEEEVEKVEKLYDLGVERGFIKPKEEQTDEPKAEETSEQPKEEPNTPVDPAKKSFNDYNGVEEGEGKLTPEELFNLSEEDEPKEEPKEEEPKEEPKEEEPKEEEPKEEPPAEPPAEEPKAEEPPPEEPKEEPKAEEPPAEPKAEEPKEEPKEEDPKEEPKTEEPKKGDGEGEPEKKELTSGEKELRKDEYIKMFKSVLLKQGLEKAVNDMSVAEKAAFWKEVSDTWEKEDPCEFLTAKDQEDLDKVVVKK